MATLESAIILPSSPAAMRIEYGGEDSVDSLPNPFSRAMKQVDWGGRQLAFGVTMPPMNQRNAGLWWGALMQAWDEQKPVLWGDPVRNQGNWQGTPLVNADYVEGDLTIVVKGMTASDEDAGKAGDRFTIENALYELTSDAQSDPFGKMYCDIFPAVRPGGLAVNAPVVVSGSGIAQVAQGLFLLADRPNKTASGKRLYSISFNLIENIED